MTRVVDPVYGAVFPCCWADCERAGADEIYVMVTNPPNPPVKYIFCSYRHRDMYVNGHVDYGNLPTGSRGKII